MPPCLRSDGYHCCVCMCVYVCVCVCMCVCVCVWLCLLAIVCVQSLEQEEKQIRSTRANRRSLLTTQFLSMSPCLPDIPMG